MNGFREVLYNKCLPLIDRSFWHGVGAFTPDELSDLRELWECGKHNNLLMVAITDLMVDDHTALDIVSTPGFLNTHELWHTRRVRGRKVIAHRGCQRGEFDEVTCRNECFGPSWSLSRDIAAWFADRGRDPGVVVTAAVEVDAWLDTVENEVVAFFCDLSAIIRKDIGGRPRLVNQARLALEGADHA